MVKSSLAVGAPPRSPRDRFLATADQHPGRTDRCSAPGLFGAVELWFRRMKDRHELRRIAEAYPDYLLSDVGLRREDMLREAVKPFWRP